MAESVKIEDSGSGKMATLERDLAAAGGAFVKIGYIAGKNERRKGEPITNAQLAIIHNYGTKHIPARPYLRPALRWARPQVIPVLEKGLSEAAAGDQSAFRRALLQAGTIVQSRAKDNIVSQRGFPPLKAATIRARRRKGGGGNAGGFKGSKALIVTGQLLNGIQVQVGKGKDA